VRGRLVPQNANDEPAGLLLARVGTERARLAAAGKILGASPLPAVPETERPFDVPGAWEWSRLGFITDIGGGVTKGRKLAGQTVRPFPYLRVANVQAGHLDLRTVKTIEIPPAELPRYRLVSGDLLLTEGGDWDKLGRSAIWHGEIADCIHQNHVFRARSLRPGDVLPRWLNVFTNAPDGRGYFQACSKQTTNLASINKTQLTLCPVPLPPASEQRRILERVDRLLALLDRLEARLSAARTGHAAFADAAVHHLGA
jgi:type I restriction enzyme S subunit